MTRKSFATLGIVIVLLVSLVSTVAAQTGTTPTTSPTPTSDAATTSLYAHPIVQILAAYFGRFDATETQNPTATATATATETATPEGTTTETETPDATETVTGTPEATETPETTEVDNEDGNSQGSLAQEIETYHEDGIGFGVLVKLYAMAEASKIACPATPTTGTTTTTSNGTTTDTTTTTGATTATPCTVVTVEQLVQQFKSGTGMGLLFKEYGKPSLLGVGQVKHALLEAEQDQESVTNGTPEPTQTGALTNKHQKNNKLFKNLNKGHNNNNQQSGNDD